MTDPTQDEMDKREEIAEYILKQCGGLNWWWLSKKWKRIHARGMAKMIYDMMTDFKNVEVKNDK